MLNTSIEPARERAEEAILASDAIDAVIARREASRARPDDDALTEQHVAELADGQGDDGSWDGELVRTAEMLLLLHDLVAPDGDGAAAKGRTDGFVRARATATPVVERGMAWLRSRRRRPGCYGEGCTPERHAEAFCHHFMGGFFSPGPPEAPAAGVRLGVGVEIEDEEEARLVASCVALRAAVRWGGETTDARLHLRALHRLIARWDRWEDGSHGPAAGLSMLLAMLEAPPSDAGRQAISHGLGHIERSQRADGSWPGADTFHVLETLLRAVHRGYRSDVLEATLARGAGLLATTQSPDDGMWGRETTPRRLRIGWQALRAATGAAD